MSYCLKPSGNFKSHGLNELIVAITLNISFNVGLYCLPKSTPLGDPTETYGPRKKDHVELSNSLFDFVKCKSILAEVLQTEYNCTIKYYNKNAATSVATSKIH